MEVEEIECVNVGIVDFINFLVIIFFILWMFEVMCNMLEVEIICLVVCIMCNGLFEWCGILDFKFIEFEFYIVVLEGCV